MLASPPPAHVTPCCPHSPHPPSDASVAEGDSIPDSQLRKLGLRRCWPWEPLSAPSGRGWHQKTACLPQPSSAQRQPSEPAARPRARQTVGSSGQGAAPFLQAFAERPSLSLPRRTRQLREPHPRSLPPGSAAAPGNPSCQPGAGQGTCCRTGVPAGAPWKPSGARSAQAPPPRARALWRPRSPESPLPPPYTAACSCASLPPAPDGPPKAPERRQKRAGSATLRRALPSARVRPPGEPSAPAQHRQPEAPRSQSAAPARQERTPDRRTRAPAPPTYSRSRLGARKEGAGGRRPEGRQRSGRAGSERARARAAPSGAAAPAGLARRAPGGGSARGAPRRPRPGGPGLRRLAGRPAACDDTRAAGVQLLPGRAGGGGAQSECDAGPSGSVDQEHVGGARRTGGPRGSLGPLPADAGLGLRHPQGEASQSRRGGRARSAAALMWDRERDTPAGGGCRPARSRRTGIPVQRWRRPPPAWVSGGVARGARAAPPLQPPPASSPALPSARRGAAGSHGPGRGGAGGSGAAAASGPHLSGVARSTAPAPALWLLRSRRRSRSRDRRRAAAPRPPPGLPSEEPAGPRRGQQARPSRRRHPRRARLRPAARHRLSPASRSSRGRGRPGGSLPACLLIGPPRPPAGDAARRAPQPARRARAERARTARRGRAPRQPLPAPRGPASPLPAAFASAGRERSRAPRHERPPASPSPADRVRGAAGGASSLRDGLCQAGQACLAPTAPAAERTCGCSGTGGEFTHLSPHAASVTDYILPSPELLPVALDFQIGLRTDSDHLPLLLSLVCPSSIRASSPLLFTPEVVA
ncbi:collagen alpha-1(I) chain-like [Tiliqua scincoides]|uniref:collagen alpha-1(I) chain-like n=1 Tax=Tiliqua scincoides TaxID=71010 RepID=UPI003462E9C8